ncbi:MAG: peptidoglycan recognition family protein [Planctomycetota bacterium]
MSLSRRHVLLAGLGLAFTGCASTSGSRSAAGGRPGPLWPEDVKRPTPTKSAASTSRPADGYRPIHRPKGDLPTAAAAAPPAPAGVLPRKHWTRHGITSRNINAMNGVKKITIHHEGWTPFTATSAAATYDRIESIRQIHTRDRGWSDIGYHFIIDRQGRIVEGRPLAYQGAHVSENNPHNMGILVLGNFEKQTPSKKQVEALGRFTRQMMKAHRVPASRVRTHKEINPTQCPGRHLQAQVDLLRRRGTLA